MDRLHSVPSAPALFGPGCVAYVSSTSRYDFKRTAPMARPCLFPRRTGAVMRGWCSVRFGRPRQRAKLWASALAFSKLLSTKELSLVRGVNTGTVKRLMEWSP